LVSSFINCSNGNEDFPFHDVETFLDGKLEDPQPNAELFPSQNGLEGFSAVDGLNRNGRGSVEIAVGKVIRGKGEADVVGCGDVSVAVISWGCEGEIDEGIFLLVT